MNIKGRVCCIAGKYNNKQLVDVHDFYHYRQSYSYDLVHDLDDVLCQFNAVIELDWLNAVYFNDNKNTSVSHKDRHEKLRQSCIGIEALKSIVLHPLLAGLPSILEIPNEEEGYIEEILTILGWTD